MDARWSAGTWLGKGWRSGEHWIHSEGEINKCQGLQGVPLEDRWSKAEVEKIVATPWRQNPSPQSRAEMNGYSLLFPRTVGLPTSGDHVNPRSGSPSALASLNPTSVAGVIQTDAIDADR